MNTIDDASNDEASKTSDDFDDSRLLSGEDEEALTAEQKKNLRVEKQATFGGATGGPASSSIRTNKQSDDMVEYDHLTMREDQYQMDSSRLTSNEKETGKQNKKSTRNSLLLNYKKTNNMYS